MSNMVYRWLSLLIARAMALLEINTHPWLSQSNGKFRCHSPYVGFGLVTFDNFVVVHHIRIRLQTGTEAGAIAAKNIVYMSCCQMLKTHESVDEAADEANVCIPSCSICSSLIPNYRTSFNSTQQKRKKSYFHFKFKLFRGAIFLVDGLFIIVQYVLCHVDTPQSGRLELISAVSVQPIECPCSVASYSDIWLNIHLRFYDILTFPVSFMLASVIFCWNCGEVVRMNGTKKFPSTLRHHHYCRRLWSTASFSKNVKISDG